MLPEGVMGYSADRSPRGEDASAQSGQMFFHEGFLSFKECDVRGFSWRAEKEFAFNAALSCNN